MEVVATVEAVASVGNAEDVVVEKAEDAEKTEAAVVAVVEPKLSPLIRCERVLRTLHCSLVPAPLRKCNSDVTKSV